MLCFVPDGEGEDLAGVSAGGRDVTESIGLAGSCVKKLIIWFYKNV